MTRLILVRHGETEMNRADLMQGTSESPLTKAGVEQAKATARVLDHIVIDATYVSPAGRTRHTADILMEKHPQTPVRVLPGLREMDFGECEGQPNEEVWKNKDALQVFGDLVFQGRGGFVGGETASHMLSRAAETLKLILAAPQQAKHVLLVGHGVLLWGILAQIGIDPRELRPLSNASISLIDVEAPDGPLRVRGINLSPAEALTILS